MGKGQMTDNPVPILNPQARLSGIKGSGFVFVGGIWGKVDAGQTVLASDGPRFLWSADPLTVIFYQRGKFFAQSTKGFAGEIRTTPFVEAGRRAAPMARLAEAEMRLLTGILAGSSGFGFATVIGTEIAGFILENRRNFAQWQRSLEAVLKAREYLKTYAPTLYEKVFDSVLNRVFADVKSKIPHAVTPDAVAFGVGVVCGSVGKKMAEGRFSLLAVIFAVVEQLAVRFSLSVLPEAFRLTGDEYRRLANEIIAKLRAAGVFLQEGDIRKIIDEVQHHPTEIKRAYEMLKEAFGQSTKF
jgi:hypothetical protein